MKGKGMELANDKAKSPSSNKRRVGAEGAAANGKPNPTINSKEKGRGARALGPAPPHSNKRLGRAEGAAASGRPYPDINSKEKGRGARAVGSTPPHSNSNNSFGNGKKWWGDTPTPPRFLGQHQQQQQHHQHQQQHQHQQHNYYIHQQQLLPHGGWQQQQYQQPWQQQQQHHPGHYSNFGHWTDPQHNINHNSFSNFNRIGYQHYY